MSIQGIWWPNCSFGGTVTVPLSGSQTNKVPISSASFLIYIEGNFTYNENEPFRIKYLSGMSGGGNMVLKDGDV